MEVFRDVTTAGHEQAIRKGKQVPEGDINLAYFKSPDLTPENNVVIVDTSRIIQENEAAAAAIKKLYYANLIGVLEDSSGNQLVSDQYPAVTDEFDVPEDFFQYPGSLYVADDMLPFVHVSRYFHLDFSGQTLGNDLITFKSPFVRVVDSNGQEYVKDDGSPRYKIKIIAGVFNRPTDHYEQAPYRLHVYIDTDEREDLFLSYNKIEIDHNGNLTRQAVGYQERLNPKAYFEYQPEEAAVFDPENRMKKWYSTKPLTLKEQILDLPKPSVDGYKVYVPKKAVPDPRLFQLFRWRVNCSFNQPYEVDPTRQFRAINCGVIVTTQDLQSAQPSRATYVFYNLMNSGYNATNVGFVNPITDPNPGLTPSDGFYWWVNIDTVTTEELSQYDVLVWAPNSTSYDFTRYQAKIDYFTSNLGGTIFIDTDSYTYATGLGSITNALTAAVDPWSGKVRSSGPAPVAGPLLPTNNNAVLNTLNELIDGENKLSGWAIHDTHTSPSGNEAATLSYGQSRGVGYTQYLNTNPLGCNWLVAVQQNNQYHYLIVERPTGRGHLVFSTIGLLFTCNALMRFSSPGSILDANMRVQRLSVPDYDQINNSSLKEGAMKFLFNVCLQAVKDKFLRLDNPNRYSTSWSFSTPWQSSWVINAGDGVLTDEEINRFQFSFAPEDVEHPKLVWQRKLSDKSMRQLIDEVLPEDVASVVQGATRNYTIEITNSQVSAPSVLGDNSFPYAWTEAYSPSFQVPVELGPYIVKEEEIKGNYEAGQYVYRSYPAKPYSGQVQVSYVDTIDDFVPTSVKWVATGTATETITITEKIPAVVTGGLSEVKLNWIANGTDQLAPGGENPYKGAGKPVGIYMLQEAEYHANLWGNVQNNWIHYGIFGQFDIGSSGEEIAFVQWALNRIQFWRPNLLSGPGLAIDGVYGGATKAKMRQLQVSLNARYIDGVVDAESLSLIGGQLVGLNFLVNGINAATAGTDYVGYTRYARAAVEAFGQLQGMSDGNFKTAFMKRSWVRKGPNFIWDTFFFGFTQAYNIHGITIIPYIQGATNTMLLRAVDVRLGYNTVIYPEQMTLPNLGFRLAHLQPFYLPFGPYYGAAFAITIGQDGPAVEASRCFGIQDVWAHAQVDTTKVIPAHNKIIKQTKTVTISQNGVVNITTTNPVTVTVIPNLVNVIKKNLSNIKWTGVTVDSPNVHATITPKGQITFTADAVVQAVNSSDPTQFTFGAEVPSTDGSAVFYSCDEHKRVNPVPETGWISKIDGIKLFCNKDGSPYGFISQNGSSIFPTGVGAKDAQRHYTKVTLVPHGVDTSVVFAFYDIARQEFIRDATGKSELSFEEYLTRGPNNVYIGALSTYELDTVEPLPPADNAPPLPYRMAMPIYGVLTKGEPHITLEPVPSNLTYGDIWPVAIKDGQFDRLIRIRSVAEGPLTGYLTRYQDQVVHAYYGIPEATDSGWSLLFGPPNVDVKGEEPIIEDDTVIQVRQPPILLHRIPTIYNTLADPVRPQFKVFRADNPAQMWSEISLHDIADYNASTGEIWLKQPLQTTDPSLVKVDYTSVRGNFYFKGFGQDLLNLNPYPGQSRSFIGQAVHIYILPAFVKDSQDNVISDSIQFRTVHFTTDTDIFDPLSPTYNPLAVQLGVVYISPALDINQLALLDTRRRGGGALNSMDTSQVVRLISEASTYWDMSFGTGLSYQKGGFVIVRLPAALKQYFSEDEIRTVIDRNLTAGVRYKIEDLTGQDWS